MECIFFGPPEAKARGYSKAVVVDDWIYIGATSGENYETGHFPEGVVEQTEQVLANLEAVLKLAGSGFEDVVKRAIYLRDAGDAGVVYDLIGRTMSSKCTPASQGFRIDFLDPRIKVEMTLVAKRGAGRR